MLTEEQIQFLNKACRNKWTEENGVININDYINICDLNLTQIPVQFGEVDGTFNCDFNQLTTLKGSPYIINNCFSCQHNHLTTLLNGPKIIDGSYACGANLLTNLIGAPEICNDKFFCDLNQLTSLEGCPLIIKGNLYCDNNPNLNILYGLGRIEGKVSYNNNINDLNEWIISRAYMNIFSSYEDISRWIKTNEKYQFLLYAKQELRKYFSPRILHLADSGLYNL